MKRMVILAALTGILASGCTNQDTTRSDYQARSGERDLFQSGPDGMILSDPLKRDVGAWYRQSYTLWTVDHRRLSREIQERNPKGIRVWHDNVSQDIRNMLDCLAEDKDREALQKVLEDYEWVKNSTVGRQGSSMGLARMESIERTIKHGFTPGAAKLKTRELTPEDVAPQPQPEEQPKEDESNTPKVKPKW